MNYLQIILQAAKAAHVSGMVLLAICTHESNLKNVVVKNDGGSPSIGICQLKTETAKLVGFKGTAKDLMNPSTNAKFAALYLKKQLRRYDGNLCKSISSYNAGKFNESKKFPGYPRNMKYVSYVKKILRKSSTQNITCGTIHLKDEYAQSNGFRL